MTPWALKMKQRQEAGLCRLCGADQEPGRALCLYHLEKERERKRARDYSKKEKGLCVEGGCRRKAAGDHIRCAKCHAKFRELNTAWQRANRARLKETS